MSFVKQRYTDYIKASLLNAFTYIFGWVFTTGDGGTLTHWPVLISIVFMVLVFIKQFVGHIIHGTH